MRERVRMLLVFSRYQILVLVCLPVLLPVALSAAISLVVVLSPPSVVYLYTILQLGTFQLGAPATGLN